MNTVLLLGSKQKVAFDLVHDLNFHPNIFILVFTAKKKVGTRVEAM